MESTDEQASFIVTVRDSRLINDIVFELEALGLNVERVMKRAGVLGVRGATSLLQQIAALPGVKHVRAEHEFQLPPLHDEIPQ
mgnify:CR=1 FL=1|jgi:hypothetical protein